MPRKILRALLIVGILAAGLGVAALLFVSREAPPTRPAPSTALLVETVPPERFNANFTTMHGLWAFLLGRNAQRSKPETA